MAQVALIAEAGKAMSKSHAQKQQIFDDWIRRDQTAIRGPPPKESVKMVKYIIIAVVIIAIIIIYYGIGRKWVEPPKYQSVFDDFLPDRASIPLERRPERHLVSDSTRVFGVLQQVDQSSK
jgi:hypothetical protein